MVLFESKYVNNQSQSESLKICDNSILFLTKPFKLRSDIASKCKPSRGEKMGNVRSKTRLTRIILPQRDVIHTCYSRNPCLGPTLLSVRKHGDLWRFDPRNRSGSLQRLKKWVKNWPITTNIRKDASKIFCWMRNANSTQRKAFIAIF